MEFLNDLDQYIIIALAIVGGASLIVEGLAKIAHVTPSTKDDQYITKTRRALGYIADLLSKIARNPK